MNTHLLRSLILQYTVAIESTYRTDPSADLTNLKRLRDMFRRELRILQLKEPHERS